MSRLFTGAGLALIAAGLATASQPRREDDLDGLDPFGLDEFPGIDISFDWREPRTPPPPNARAIADPSRQGSGGGAQRAREREARQRAEREALYAKFRP